MYCPREKGLAPCKPQIITRAPSASEVSDSAQPRAVASSLGLGGLGAWPRPPRGRWLLVQTVPCRAQLPGPGWGTREAQALVRSGGPGFIRELLRGSLWEGTWGQNVGAVAGQARGTPTRCVCQPETSRVGACADPS